MLIDSKTIVLLLSLLSVLGCDASGAHRDSDDDPLIDAGPESHADAGPDSGLDGDECADGLELIYVVDSANVLYSFDPAVQSAAAFQQVGTGTLSCPSGGQPFSMAVGRDGYAYVLFQSELGDCVGVNKISIETGVCEAQTPYVCGSNGDFPCTFGMGYVTDGPSTTAERLFVTASGQSGELAALGVLDPSTGALSSTGGVLQADGGEFTGNGLGELWGFFPQAEVPSVARIDKTSGGMVDTANDYYDVSSAITGAAMSWAFAYWGNAFYIFYQSASDDSTDVYILDLSTGATNKYIPDTQKSIVGAGVSTCAPVELE